MTDPIICNICGCPGANPDTGKHGPYADCLRAVHTRLDQLQKQIDILRFPYKEDTQPDCDCVRAPKTWERLTISAIFGAGQWYCAKCGRSLGYASQV